MTSSLDMPASSINSRCYVPFDEKISTMTTMSGYRKHSSTGSNCSTSSWSTYSPTSTVPPSLTSGRHRSVSPSLTMGYSPSPYQGGGGDPGGHTSPPFGGGGVLLAGPAGGRSRRRHGLRREHLLAVVVRIVVIKISIASKTNSE